MASELSSADRRSGMGSNIRGPKTAVHDLQKMRGLGTMLVIPAPCQGGYRDTHADHGSGRHRQDNNGLLCAENDNLEWVMCTNTNTRIVYIHM